MKELKADLHVHTCLSPCAAAEMVPTAIVKRARSAGLDMIGICDHNASENVPAVVRAGRRESVCVIPGIEVTSREEVHVLGLFHDEQELASMQTVVYDHLAGENDEATFGPQTIVDDRDRPRGANPRLLLGATDLSIEDLIGAVHEFGGLAVAAHVDRPSFGLVGQLGFVPEGIELDALEVSPGSRIQQWDDWPVVTSSDAHTLADIGRSFTMFIAQEPSLEEMGRALRQQHGRRISTRMQDLSLHILDIVENAIAASATRIRIRIAEDTRNDRLSVEINDNGKGMDPQSRAKALDPFFTTRTTRRVGLGLPLLAQAAREANGSIEIQSAPGQGTTIKANFEMSHPDCKPLGDIAGTLRAIRAARPELELQFEYERDSERVANLSSGPPDDKESNRGKSDD